MPQRNTHIILVTNIKMALVVIKEINSTETEMFFFLKKKKNMQWNRGKWCFFLSSDTKNTLNGCNMPIE
jgi:hypothetical protein